MKDNKPKTFGVILEDSEDVTIGNYVTDSDVALLSTKSRQIKIGNLNQSSVTTDELESLKNSILKEIEDILIEGLKKNEPKRYEQLIHFISAVGSASVVELLKAYGVLPSQQ